MMAAGAHMPAAAAAAPTMAAAAAPVAAGAAAAAAAHGWTEHRAPDGRPYYHHAASGKTHYDKPDALKTAA